MNSLIHDTGTVSVAEGSAIVDGVLTGWAVALVQGGVFSCRGVSIPIASVEDDTHLTLAYPWPGEDATGQTYAIARMPSEATARAATWTLDRLAKLAQTPWGVGVAPDARGTLVERDALDPMPTDDFCWLRIEVDEPAELYFRVGGQWVGPYPFKGEQGDPGGQGEPGPAGAGFDPAGEWDNAVTYSKNDMVWWGVRSFVSFADGNIGNEPPSADEDDAYWQFVPAPQGGEGPPGNSAYVYIAYASDGTGSDFTTTFDADLDYIAILDTTTEIPAPAVGDFAGLWKNYRGEQGYPGTPGAPGTPGTPGAPGADGEDGSLWYTGASDPSSGTGENGDFYLQTGNGSTGIIGDVWEKAAGSWSVVGNIRGASGSGTGDMLAATYDPQGKAADAFARANHTGTQSADTITDGTANKAYTAAEKSKLGAIAAGAQVNTVTSVAGKTGAVTLAKGDVGLGNVDNTTDLNKPISTATQTALNGKAGTAVATTSANGLMSSTDKSKLNGIASGATANTGTVTSVAASVPTGLSVSGSPITGSGTLAITYAAGYQGFTSSESSKLAGVAAGATANTGTVTSVGLSVPTGLSVSGSPVTTSGTFAVTWAAGYQGYTTAEATKLSNAAVLNAENQSLTGGATVTSKSLGTLTTGTLTLDMGDRPLQHYTNNGAHTLAPGSVNGSCLVDVTNGASAGAITTSGWTKVAGDSFTTTNGHKFRCHCSVGSGGSLLIVQALQ